jgi:hypothetical protein
MNRWARLPTTFRHSQLGIKHALLPAVRTDLASNSLFFAHAFHHIQPFSVETPNPVDVPATKLLHACSLAVSVFSSIVAANPLRLTVTIDDKPDAPAALTAAMQPVEWQNCGHPWDVFQLKNITTTPNPPVT